MTLDRAGSLPRTSLCGVRVLLGGVVWPVKPSERFWRYLTMGFKRHLKLFAEPKKPSAESSTVG